MRRTIRIFDTHTFQSARQIRSTVLVAGLFALLGCLGCEPNRGQQTSDAKPPKPVSVMTLSRSKQLQEQLITGSIAPWKTEQVGFEVAGRVNFVIELNEEIQPVLPSGIALPATPLATLDPERFEIAVDTALADVQVVQRQFDANQVAVTQRLPATIESAVSEVEVAQADFNRAEQLVERSAISRAEYDDAKNRLRAATAAQTASEAQLAQAKAEQAALDAQVKRAVQAVEEAKRNLRNTRLFSSFRGIISQVHTVPGSYVSPGDPVVTVQMMDPMLVEFEVSPQDSRRYKRGDILDVFVSNNGGERELASGMVYTVDAVADPNSRTYTVALHIRNEKETTFDATQAEVKDLAQTEEIFPLNVGPVITGDARQLIEQRCLHKIGDATVVWKILNRKSNQATNPEDRVLVIEPVRVSCGDEVIPLLGHWNFLPVTFEDPANIDIENDLITGQIEFPDAAPSADDASSNHLWSQRRALLRQRQWKLRTGDVVQVLMSGNTVSQGYFVPMKAILSDNGSSFLHVLEQSENGVVIARRVGVTLQKGNSVVDETIRVQVQPIQSGSLRDGMQIVVSGTHYLTDGDRVNVVPARGASL